MKRFLDIFISVLALSLILPFFLIIPILIKWTSKGPVFFKQKRVKKDGETFCMLKFRTMVDEADSLKRELMRHNEMEGPLFKIKNDPRITKLGKFLRKYSLDELPQLFNVLRADMSLVGPRPPTYEEYQTYSEEQKKRLKVPVGITGLWQVSGRNNVSSFDDVLKLDLEYIENYSFFLDLKILFRTIPAVLFSRGAH